MIWERYMNINQKHIDAQNIIQNDDKMNRLLSEFAHRQEFTLILGAGCSIHCGVPNFDKLKRLILSLILKGGKENELNNIDIELFNQEWESIGSNNFKHSILSNFILKRPPSFYVYYLLADIIKNGYFNTIVTYNIDNYLESALHSVNYDDFIALINGVHENSYIQQMIEDKSMTKILKTHGDHKHKSYALSSREIIEHGRKIEPILEKITKNKLLIVGYSALDFDFLRSINISDNGEEIWFVNPINPLDNLLAIMTIRHSNMNIINLNFEDFFSTLHYSLKNYGLIVGTIEYRTKFFDKDNYRKLTIQNKLGLHAKPAALIVKLVSKFRSEISIKHNTTVINGKSIMGIMMLGIQKDSEIEICANGVDSRYLLDALEDLINNKFYEE